MERRKQEERAKLRWLRGAAKDGLDQLDHGEGLEFDSIDELDRHIDRLTNEAAARPARKNRRG